MKPVFMVQSHVGRAFLRVPRDTYLRNILMPFIKTWHTHSSSCIALMSAATRIATGRPCPAHAKTPTMDDFTTVIGRQKLM